MKTTTEYIPRKNHRKTIKTELWFTPALLITPIIISIIFLSDWYTRGFLTGSSSYNRELLLGLIILIGNLIFDIPFLRSLKPLIKQ